MKKISIKKLKIEKASFFGGVIGLVNGFFGAGGGLVCVPLLIKTGMDRKTAHANAVAVIVPITVFSAASYLLQGRVTLLDPLPYLPGGIAGAILGTYILKKISPKFIRKLFGGFMIWAGWRLLFG